MLQHLAAAASAAGAAAAGAAAAAVAAAAAAESVLMRVITMTLLLAPTTASVALVASVGLDSAEASDGHAAATVGAAANAVRS